MKTLKNFQAQKNKNNLPREYFLYFRKQKPPKNFLYFFKRKLFLYFRKRKLPKIPYISANEKTKKLLIFREVTLQARKLKISYTFRYKELKFSKLKHFFIIIIKRFFSFCNLFFYTQQTFPFHLLIDF